MCKMINNILRSLFKVLHEKEFYLKEIMAWIIAESKCKEYIFYCMRSFTSLNIWSLL